MPWYGINTKSLSQKPKKDTLTLYSYTCMCTESRKPANGFSLNGDLWTDTGNDKKNNCPEIHNMRNEAKCWLWKIPALSLQISGKKAVPILHTCTCTDNEFSDWQKWAQN